MRLGSNSSCVDQDKIPEREMQFSKLDDSPMFRQEIQCLEENAETMRDRSLKFCKGCRKYTEGLGEGYNKDIAFASAIETFGGGNNDPLSVSFGGFLSLISINNSSTNPNMMTTFQLKKSSFMRRGASPWAVDMEGQTPIQLITESDFDNVEVLALFKNTESIFY